MKMETIPTEIIYPYVDMSEDHKTFIDRILTASSITILTNYFEKNKIRTHRFKDKDMYICRSFIQEVLKQKCADNELRIITSFYFDAHPGTKILISLSDKVNKVEKEFVLDIQYEELIETYYKIQREKFLKQFTTDSTVKDKLKENHKDQVKLLLDNDSVLFFVLYIEKVEQNAS